MSRSRNTQKGHKHQGCPAGRKCDYCADNRQFNTKKRLGSTLVEEAEGRMVGGCFEPDDNKRWGWK